VPAFHRLVLAGLFFLLLNVAAQSASPQRLHAANALLVMQPPFPRANGSGTPIIIYREPGVGRIAVHTFPEMAKTVPSFASQAGTLMVPASRRKGQWVRIPYDDAGREGWIRMERTWKVISWEEFLPGTTVRLLPGLKKNFYMPSSVPENSPAENGQSLQNETLRIEAVEGQWARVKTASGDTVRVRWRDDDGRLTIAPASPPENN
jgi:hypothetical protein